jgi:multidrug efflux system outer membrane protein
MKVHSLIAAAVAGLVFASCSVGPDYKRPAALQNQPQPKSFTVTTDGTNQVVWKVAEPSADAPRGQWWQVFSDTNLNCLELMALTNNQNLVAAAAQLEQARDILAETRSRFYPQITAGGTPGGDFTHQRTSVNAPDQGVANGSSFTYNTFTAPVYMGWEIDLWGRVRRETEAAHAQYVASADDLESAKLDVAAEVANDYFVLKTLDAQYSLIAGTIDSYRRSLDLTKNRRAGGVATDLDVAQAQTQLDSTEAELPDILLRRADTLHALAIICGQSPIDFFMATNSIINTNAPVIPMSLPSDLLEHRPDVAAAERLMAAANANVGVAKAAFFPAVSINGLAGFQSVNAGTWFNWSSRLWSVGPNIELPLFTGGFNRANLAQAHAAYNQQVAVYRQIVLTAFGQVEDQLAAQKLLADEWSALNESAVSAQHALDIANNRYKEGLITYLDVVTAQTTALTQESDAVNLQGQRLTAAVNLIKALGCDWQQTQQ